MVKIKSIYRKNLKMPEGKVASQIAHAIKNLPPTPKECIIIVLKVSDKRFDELVEQHPGCYVQKDLGVDGKYLPGTRTAAAWIEEEN